MKRALAGRPAAQASEGKTISGGGMAEQSLYAEAYRAIGEFFCEFSKLERELGETIKVIFRLEKHESSDAVVAALGEAAKKINLVWAAALAAKNPDGSETTKKWKNAAHRTMTAIWERNGIRNQLAHSYLEPLADGSVAVARLKVERGEVTGGEKQLWEEKKFETQVGRIKELTAKLESMKSDLSTLKITLPDMSWLHTLSQPYAPRKMSAALMASLSGAPVPVPGEDIPAHNEPSE